MIGPVPEIQACAGALSSAELAMAPLVLELLDQLAQVSPKPIIPSHVGRSLDFSVKTGIMGVLTLPLTPSMTVEGISIRSWQLTERIR